MVDNAVNEIKCPACGAPMRFDPASGKMLCEFCGTTAEIEGKKDADNYADTANSREYDEFEGLDINSLNSHVSDENANTLPIYLCKSCGAELIAPPEQVSLTCPHCGSNVVLTDKVSGKLRPDGLIPFKIEKKKLPEAIKQYYRGKVLLPPDFFSRSKMEKITGVYVPFWIFSGRLSGTLYFRGEKIKSSRKGDYLETTTSVFDVDRNVSMEFSDLPVDASGKMDDELMDSIEPFDVVDFNMNYLAGYTADRFDETKEQMSERAKKRMFTSAENAATSRIGSGYTSLHKTGGHLKADLKARYILIPVYRFKLEYAKKEYEFAVNGQTGKIVGSLPISFKVCARYFLLRAVPVTLIIIGCFVARYLMGR